VSLGRGDLQIGTMVLISLRKLFELIDDRGDTVAHRIGIILRGEISKLRGEPHQFLVLRRKRFVADARGRLGNT
jgi:hypothetical protein